METSKKYMESKGFGDRISFNDLSAHTVKLINEKEDTIPDGNGGTVSGMKYLVEEAGKQKTIFTGSIGLIAKLSVCEIGDEVTIQMTKKNNKSYYNVIKAGKSVGDSSEHVIQMDDVNYPAADEVPADEITPAGW